jgi:hypothetical protein
MEMSGEIIKNSADDCIRYLANGRIVRLISTIERAGRAPQFVVELGFYSDTGDGCPRKATSEDDIDFDNIEFGNECIVDIVFESPPIEAISRKIEKLDERKQTLMNQVAVLKEGERTLKQRLEYLKKYDQLSRIEDFLAGKITHYCKDRNPYSRIQTPIVVRVADEDQHARDLKLLCLFGKSDRSMEWKLNRYSDGSGDWSRIWPFCSQEEAEVKAREILAESFMNFRKEYPNGYPCLGRDLVEAAKACGAPIPVGFERDMLQDKLAEATESSKKKQEESKNADAIVANIAAQLNAIKE